MFGHRGRRLRRFFYGGVRPKDAALRCRRTSGDMDLIRRRGFVGQQDPVSSIRRRTILQGGVHPRAFGWRDRKQPAFRTARTKAEHPIRKRLNIGRVHANHARPRGHIIRRVNRFHLQRRMASCNLHQQTVPCPFATDWRIKSQHFNVFQGKQAKNGPKEIVIPQQTKCEGIAR